MCVVHISLNLRLVSISHPGPFRICPLDIAGHLYQQPHDDLLHTDALYFELTLKQNDLFITALLVARTMNNAVATCM